ncbi:MAG: YaeQ family protein [Polyangiaceae bacterium]
MALGSTVHRVEIALSDVDRGVYESLDVRLAQHPSESLRYLVTRMLAYALSYEEGIQFSKGGLSSTDEPPISIVDPTGILVAWIDVGTPSAERIHRASKAAGRVAIWTSTDLALLRKEAENKAIHRASEIAVHRIDSAFLDALEAIMNRRVKIDLTRTDGALYANVEGKTFETTLLSDTLAAAE